MAFGDNKVMVGYCSPLQLHARFTNSLTALLDHDHFNQRHIVASCSLLSGPRVAEARSQITDFFLLHEEKPDWLLMLDSDMVFEPTLVDDLLRWADLGTVPIVGALCFAGVHGGNMYPTLYRSFNEGEDSHLGVEPVDDYPKDALVKVAATGAACVLIHRNVFALMKRKSNPPGESFDPLQHGFGTLTNGKENPFPWWVEGAMTSRGIPLGEDIAFFRKCLYLNIPIHVHTGIKVGHAKEWVIGEDDYDTWRREKHRPGPMLDAAVQVLRESGRFAPDELNQIVDYLRPRRSILSDTERPKPKPFLLPEPVG